jgi:NitT/TauT family transport system ATP-binding protein
VEGLCKSFERPGSLGPLQVLNGISFEVKEGAFVSIVGPSGCGKTTLLRIISGLDTPTSGRIHIEPSDSQKAIVGMVFQEYGLFPWRTALGNIEFGLEIMGVDARERRERALSLIERLGLLGFEDHYPGQLSGGMRQRVAIARTLVVEPSIILMDEPFGSLDSQTRSDMQEFLLGLWEERKDTILFVTHNVQEAIYLGTRLLMFSSRPASILKAWELGQCRKVLPLQGEAKELEAEINRMLKEERRRDVAG